MTDRNGATDENDDEALCMIIRRTKQNKGKHRLPKAVGRPESEWSFIGEGRRPFVCRICSLWRHRGSGGGWTSCAAVAAGAPWPTPSRTSKAKASKKCSMSDLFVVTPSLTLPPPANASGGNEAAVEDDDEALCAIIRWTKQM
ncbi:hypothetical protein GUJ93_ZPchr0001g29599 [Zizania palustris]|uniref:Uncharacterized protein n=1 Tax=Zizania palustris TaxID=103762 RepID=A0A8J5VM36_ZIZPA|nr:hypothetical protein GUJ93_ZPchr0001g29599 [Zizania palustris]